MKNVIVTTRFLTFVLLLSYISRYASIPFTYYLMIHRSPSNKPVLPCNRPFMVGCLGGSLALPYCIILVLINVSVGATLVLSCTRGLKR